MHLVEIPPKKAQQLPRYDSRSCPLKLAVMPLMPRIPRIHMREGNAGHFAIRLAFMAFIQKYGANSLNITDKFNAITFVLVVLYAKRLYYCLIILDSFEKVQLAF